MKKYIFLIIFLFFLKISFAQDLILTLTETKDLCNAEGYIWFSNLNKCCGNDGGNDNFYGIFRWDLNYYCCNGNLRSEIDDFIEEIGNWPVESGAIYSSPAIIDLENDGRKEILIGSILNRVPVWRYRGKPDLAGTGVTESSVYSSPVSADLDNDGYPEIIALAGNKIYIWNNFYNKQGWPIEVQISPSAPFEICSPAVADIDSDGDLEIFFGTTGGYFYGFHHDGTYITEWENKQLSDLTYELIMGQPPAIGSSPAIGDVDNDGNLEIVIASPTVVHVFKIDGTVVFEKELRAGVIGEQFQLISTSSPALADLNNDGNLEIIILSTPLIAGTYLLDQYLHVLKPNGEYFFPPVFITSHEEVSSNSASSPAVGDINLDGNLEIVFTSDNGKIHVFNKIGQEISGFPVNAGDKAMSSPALADLDDNGYLEIIAGSFDGNLYVLNHDGSAFSGFPKYIGGQIFSSPAISDLNGDGKLEIIFGTIEGELDGKVYVLSMQTKGGSEWRKFRYNSKNSGYHLGIQKPSDCSKTCVDSGWTWIQGGEGRYAPCCGDDLESDNFTTTEWVCENGQASGAEKCGNNYCGKGENCGNCPQDCICLTNENCVENTCKKVCPSSCDDYNICTLDKCSELTNHDCVHESITNCCGNSICEENENCGNCLKDCSCTAGKVCKDNQCVAGCPDSCDDGIICTKDFCSELTNYLCKHEILKPCCGDLKCESGEDFTNCCIDCGCKEEKTCINNVCISPSEVPEKCVKECQPTSTSLSCCIGLVSSNNMCIKCKDKKQASNCTGKGLCIEACGADSHCNRILPGTGNCDENCSYISPIITTEPDGLQSDCEEYGFTWIKEKCCGDDTGETWTFDNGICYKEKPYYCGNEDGFCLTEYKVNCKEDDKDCILSCLYLLPEEIIYIVENQPNAFNLEIISNCKQELKDIKINSLYLNLNQTIPLLKPDQKEKIQITRSFSKGEHLTEVQVIAEEKEKKVLLKVIAITSSKIKEKINTIINTSLIQFKTFKDNVNTLGLGVEFANFISKIEVNLDKAQEELLKGEYTSAQESISNAMYTLRLGSINLLSRVQITGWGILTILFSIGAVLSFVLYYILNIKEKYKRHLAEFQKKMLEYKQIIEEYKKPGIYTLEKEQLKNKISDLYSNLQSLKQKIKKEEEIVKKTEKEI